MKEPHIVVKRVAYEGLTPNLPMPQKWVYDLGALSVRTWNCLANDDLLSLDRLLDKYPQELLKTPNFGRKSLRELEALLAQHGLQLKAYGDYRNEPSIRIGATTITPKAVESGPA